MMIIKNLTNEPQKIQLEELTGEGRIYDTYLQPLSSTTVEGPFVVVDLPGLKGIVEVDGQEIATSEVEVPQLEEEDNLEEEENLEEVNEENVEVVEDHEEEKFLCDICGAEFASARGLASHRSRAHEGNN